MKKKLTDSELEEHFRKASIKAISFSTAIIFAIIILSIIQEWSKQ